MGQTIHADLRKVGRIIKLSTVFSGLFGWLVVCLGIWLGLFALDNALRLPPGLRFPLALAALTIALVGFVRRVGQSAARRQRAERTALFLERQYQVPDNLLINACQFEANPAEPGEAVFVAETVSHSESLLHRIPAARLWQAHRLRVWGGWVAGLSVVWMLYVALLPRYAGNALARYARPLEDIPPVSAVTLRVAPGSDLAVCEGDDVQVLAEVEQSAAAAEADEEPVLVWREGKKAIGAARAAAGESVAMVVGEGNPRLFTYTFRQVRRPFAFRVFAGDAYSRSTRVRVLNLPRLRSSAFLVTPPAYTGRRAAESPGPPAAVSALPGSTLEVKLSTDRRVRNLAWRAGGAARPFAAQDDAWRLQTLVSAAGRYEVEATDPAARRTVLLAGGEIQLTADNPPQVEFLTEDRNRFVNPGDTVRLELEASDDFGIQSIAVTTRKIEAINAPDRADGSAGRLSDGPPGGAGPATPPSSNAPPAAADTAVKTWTYLGPPGNPGPVKETVAVKIDPAGFDPGSAYLVMAICRDFSPDGQQGRSRPIVLRVKSLDALNLPEGDVMANAVSLLRKTIAEQKTAHGAAANLEAHLAEALDAKLLPSHRQNLSGKQGQAQSLGRQAGDEMKKYPAGQAVASRLTTLVEQEMGWVLTDIAKLDPGARGKLPTLLKGIVERQAYVLAQLVAILGELTSDRAPAGRGDKAFADEARAPALTPQDAARQLKDDLENFARDQKRVVQLSRSLMDGGPQDLTSEEEKILGELAREEAEWAKLFEEKLTDFSKLPMQDFADGSLSKELNEVMQEIRLAAKSLYEKTIEIAVPVEQSGLEKAEKLIHNLERWLPDMPDRLKWLMEEPLTAPDIPLADLPTELEDIVGELIDREEDMTEDVEDVTSSWLDSLDKGAGWDAMDGPISSMSAKGVTGNLLPNQMEVGGRAGEGRTGRSHGQMVESAAEGKKGRQTPTRLTPSPFESGSVRDSAKEDLGGATGGGKLSGHAGQGLRGPAPPPRLSDLTRLGGKQSVIRQAAEAVALHLRAYHVPTGDLELSIAAMKNFETAAAAGDGLGVRQAFSHVMDSLETSREAVRIESGLHREQSVLGEWMRSEIITGLRDGVPKGYEEMVSEYFRALASQGTPDGEGGKAGGGSPKPPPLPGQ